MKINANSIRAGNILEHQGKLWIVSKQPEHTMPGKGGAFIQVEMKDIKTGTKLNERFRSTENVEKIRLDQKDYQYLYTEGDFLVLMDPDNYDQTMVSSSLLGERNQFLQDGLTLIIESYNEEIINISLPEQMTFEVTETEAVIKGQTATASYKPAILANKIRVMVPPFINAGDRIIIRTQDSTYVEREKN